VLMAAGVSSMGQDAMVKQCEFHIQTALSLCHVNAVAVKYLPEQLTLLRPDWYCTSFQHNVRWTLAGAFHRHPIP
jgi:hypothetical protein